MAQRPQVLFNYFGQLDQVVNNSEDFYVFLGAYRPMASPRGTADSSTRNPLPVLNGKLEVQMDLGRRATARATDRAIAHGFVDSAAPRSLRIACRR